MANRGTAWKQRRKGKLKGVIRGNFKKESLKRRRQQSFGTMDVLRIPGQGEVTSTSLAEHGPLLLLSPPHDLFPSSASPQTPLQTLTRVSLLLHPCWPWQLLGTVVSSGLWGFSSHLSMAPSWHPPPAAPQCQHCHLFSPHCAHGHLVHYQGFRDLSEDRPRSPPYSYFPAVLVLRC